MNKYKLCDIATFINGFPFESNDMGNVGIPIIKIKELKNNKIIITESTQKISNFDMKKFDKVIINYDDILVSLTGDPVNKGSYESWVGRTGIYKYRFPALLNQRMCKIVPNNKYILEKYLYYYLISYNNLYKLAVSAKGSANQANISHKDVGNIIIDVPELSLQQHIVDIIGSIDDKIENNIGLCDKIIKILTLKYKSLKVDFVKSRFKDNFNILNGYTFKSKLYSEKGNYKVITIKNIKSSGFNTATCDLINFEDKYKQAKLKIGDILLTMTGEVGRIAIVDENNCLLNQRVLKVIGDSPSYTFAFLKENYESINLISKGSVQQNLSVTDLYNLEVPHSKETIEGFKINDLLIETYVKLKIENQKLEKLKQNYLLKFFK